MKRVAGVLALVLVVSLLGTSDVRGAAGGASPGKTTGSSVVAAIVIDVTGTGVGVFHPGKGLTSIRIQKSGSSAAALFDSGVIQSWVNECNPASLFLGKMDGWVPEDVLISLFGSTLAHTAVIVDTDYFTCAPVNNGPDQVANSGAEGGTRKIMSFMAVIQFEKL